MNVCAFKLAILLVVITSTIILYIRTVASRDKPCGKLFDLFMLMSILVLILFLVLHKGKLLVFNKHKEEFADSTDSVNKLFSLLGIQEAANTSVMASKVATDITSMNNNYNENFYAIAPNLVLYYSAFSKASYPKDNDYKWLNISPYFTAPENTCPDIRIEDTHMRFLMNPFFSKETGFSLSSNHIEGPKCHQLGITGNDSFTLFFTISISGLVNKTNGNTRSSPFESNDTFEIIKLYGNTINNNGLSIYIDKNVVMAGTAYGVNIIVEYGANKPFISKDPAHQNNLILINPLHTHLFVLVKKPGNVTLFMYPNIDNIGMNSESRMIIIEKQLDGNEVVLLSNKSLIINRNKNITGHIFNFGIYNKAIDDSHVSLLFIHIQTELHKTNKLLQDLASQIKLLQDEVKNKNPCPYNSSVCKACENIKDWSNIANIILNADNTCLSQINNFCIANPLHDHCMCWNSQNSISRTMGCQNYMSIFNNTKLVAPDNVDVDSLDVIKKKHNLCNCADIDLLRQFVNEMKQEKRQTLTRPPLISSDYKIDPNAIAVYEGGSVDNYFNSKKEKTTGNIEFPHGVQDPFRSETPNEKTKEEKNWFKKWFDVFFN